MKEIEIKLIETIHRYTASGIEQQVDYEKFYLYSLITHSTAIEGSTVTEVENQLLFDEGIAAKGRSLNEQMMNVDLKNAYLYGFERIKNNHPYTVEFLCELSAKVMRRTGSEYSTLGGKFDSSKGELRLCNVSAGIGGKSYLAFQKVPKAITDFCHWLNGALSSVNRNNIAACYRLSFEAHFRLVTIHPWVNGNGRTTRLLMNMVQRQLGLVPSIVTKNDKGEYIQALIDSRENEDSTIIQDVMIAQHTANLEYRILQYQQSINDAEKLKNYLNVQRNVQKEMPVRQKLILEMIQSDKSVTLENMSKKMNCSIKTIQREMAAMSSIGIKIEHKGGRKAGYWVISK